MRQARARARSRRNGGERGEYLSLPPRVGIVPAVDSQAFHSDELRALKEASYPGAGLLCNEFFVLCGQPGEFYRLIRDMVGAGRGAHMRQPGCGSSRRRTLTPLPGRRAAITSDLVTGLWPGHWGQ